MTSKEQGQTEKPLACRKRKERSQKEELNPKEPHP